MNEIKSRWLEVCEVIKSQSLCASQVILLAVSKKHTADKIKKLADLGQKHFGENYLQEFLEKREFLKNLPLEWHYIGRLQSNKLQAIVENFAWVHSLCELKYALKMNQLCLEKGKFIKVFIQVNVASEDSKAGVAIENLSEFVEQLYKNCTQLQVQGLMLMPPLSCEEVSRTYFRQAKILQEELKARWQGQFPEDWKILNMGTSQDYPWALQEGSELVRVGTALMGPRS